MFLFYLLVLSLPLTQHYALSYTLGGVTVAKLLGAVCMPMALIHAAGKRRIPGGLCQPGALLCVAYFLLAMISYFIAYGLAWDASGPQNNVLSILVLLLVTVAVVDSVERLRWTLLMMVGSVAIASVYAIREWLAWGHAVLGYRPGGVSGDANYFGTAAAASLPVAFVLLQTRCRRWEKLYLITCFGLTLFAFGLAASRGGLMGAVVGFLLIFIKSRRKFRSLVLATGLVIPLLAVTPNSPVERLLNPDYGSQVAVAARETTWRAGWQMFQDHPLFGVGLARFKTVVLQYEDSMAALQVQSLAHNTYIEVAAEQGLLGFLPFVATLMAAYLTLERAFRLTAKAELQFLNQACIAIQAALLAAWVGAFFVSAWWFRFYWFPVFLAVCFEPIARTVIRKKRLALAVEREGIKQPDWAGVHVNA